MVSGLAVPQGFVEGSLTGFIVGQEHLLADTGVGLEHGEYERSADSGPLGIGMNQHVLQVTDGCSIRDHAGQANQSSSTACDDDER